MINNKAAWNYYLVQCKRGYSDFDLFYDVKENKYFVSFYPDFKWKMMEYHYVYIGYFSNRCTQENFFKVLEQVKEKYSLYEVSEMLPHIKKYVCNGAGPKGFGWTIPDFKFTDAADIHDMMYTLGGNSEDRKWADYVFLWNCMRDGADWMAKVYFLNVRTFGFKAFEKREVKMNMKTLNSCKIKDC